MSRDAAYFDRMYARSPDPWGFETSAYERDKYAATLRAICGHHFASAIEIGCSIGVLTHALAAQCDALIGIDISAAPLVAARARCRDQPHVSFLQIAVPHDWPPGCFDLVVLSEVLYFLSPSDIERTARRTLDSLSPAGTVLLVNWLGDTGTVCAGDAAAQRFIAAGAPSFRQVRTSHAPGYRLDLLSRAPGDVASR